MPDATLIALLRGINVGGKNSLPMKSLVAILNQLGASNMRTYIQSGNAVFEFQKTDLDRLASKISSAIGKQHGFAPQVLLLDRKRWIRTVKANLFADAANQPNSLHIGFLASSPPAADLKGMEALRQANERFSIVKDAFYLLAPDGIGRSKLAAAAERLIGVPMTMRNWKTVGKISEMV